MHILYLFEHKITLYDHAVDIQQILQHQVSFYGLRKF